METVENQENTGSSPEQKPRPTGAERETYIFREINDSGLSRDEVAASLGINDDALYMFMRHRGYSWCGTTKKFSKKPITSAIASPSSQVPQAAGAGTEQPQITATPAQPTATPPERPAPAEDNSRQAKVVRLISSGMDCETAAHTEGFADRHELGRFMADNGYRWSCETGNYAAAEGVQPSPPEPDQPKTPDAAESVPFEPSSEDLDNNGDTTDDFELFSDHGFNPPAACELRPDNNERQEVPVDNEKTISAGSTALTPKQAQMLDYLDKNFIRLAAAINGFNGTGAPDIPRYEVTDARRPKLFMFSEELAEALKDFSARHAIDQRDLVESAIIDFMLRYGGDQAASGNFRRLLCA